MPHHDDAPEWASLYDVQEGDRCVALVHVPRPGRKLTDNERAAVMAGCRPLLTATRLFRTMLALSIWGRDA